VLGALLLPQLQRRGRVTERGLDLADRLDDPARVLLLGDQLAAALGVGPEARGVLELLDLLQPALLDGVVKDSP
jgi:hypothetical protein